MPGNNNNSVYLSIVSPVYKAEHIIDHLVSRIVEQAEQLKKKYEIILVDDCSPDNSWAKIQENGIKNKNIKGIKFSKNFGQHFAITAGLCESSGEYVIVMDCDLQDNPKYIPVLLHKSYEGYDIVYTIKEKRKHSYIKNILAKSFFAFYNYLTDDAPSSPDVGAYSLLTRKVANYFCKVKDVHRHYLLILKVLGFKAGYITILHDKRFEGRSSYTYSKLLKHALDGIVSQSNKLLRISISAGFIIFLISILWALYLIYLYYTSGLRPGYTSIMVLLLLSTGLILMSIGILGIYIGKMFEQVKDRPMYMIDEKMNM